MDKTLWSLVTEHSLLAWQRVRLANALARSGGHLQPLPGKALVVGARDTKHSEHAFS
jgi:hypothetical protein